MLPRFQRNPGCWLGNQLISRPELIHYSPDPAPRVRNAAGFLKV
jgi:hypothetical protein